MKYRVQITRSAYASAFVEVDANDADDAENIMRDRIDTRPLNEWDGLEWSHDIDTESVPDVVEAIEVPTRIACTGGFNRYPIVDRHGQRIHVGDILRAQVCIGRYGQTAIVTVEVTEAHWLYCQIIPPGGKGVITASFDFKTNNVLRCAHRHYDVEHGHETWAEIIPTKNVGEP